LLKQKHVIVAETKSKTTYVLYSFREKTH